MNLCNKYNMLIILMASTLISCGGGGGGNDSDTTDNNNSNISLTADEDAAIADGTSSLDSELDGVTTPSDINNPDLNDRNRPDAADQQAAVTDEADSLWQLEEIAFDELQRVTSPDSVQARQARARGPRNVTQETLDYTFTAAPAPPVSRAGQLLNLDDPSGTARFSATDRTWPSSTGDATIAMWSQDKLAAFSISIDDNHTKDHEFWYQMSDEYGWKWTWFIIANQVGWGEHDHWGHWQEALDKGHDVQSHTYSHLCDAIFYTYREYRQSQAAISQNLKNANPITMAYPFGIHSNKIGSPCESLQSDRTKNSREEAAKHYMAARDVYGALASPGLIDYMKVPSISAGRNFFNADASWAYFDSILDASSANWRTWYSIHYHGLYNDAAKNDVRAILAHVKSKEADVWVDSFTNVAKYGQEYATARISNLSKQSTGVSFELQDDMYDAWFNHPLTVKIRLPSNSSTLSATQNGSSISSNVVEHNGAYYAFVSAVPDQGVVTVTY